MALAASWLSRRLPQGRTGAAQHACGRRQLQDRQAVYTANRDTLVRRLSDTAPSDTNHLDGGRCVRRCLGRQLRRRWGLVAITYCRRLPPTSIQCWPDTGENAMGARGRQGSNYRASSAAMIIAWADAARCLVLIHGICSLFSGNCPARGSPHTLTAGAHQCENSFLRGSRLNTSMWQRRSHSTAYVRVLYRQAGWKADKQKCGTPSRGAAACTHAKLGTRCACCWHARQQLQGRMLFAQQTQAALPAAPAWQPHHPAPTR